MEMQIIHIKEKYKIDIDKAMDMDSKDDDTFVILSVMFKLQKSENSKFKARHVSHVQPLTL